MINCEGIWLPDDEEHLVMMIEKLPSQTRRIDGKPTYQYHKYMTALTYVKQYRVAIDIGGHVGMWSMQMAKQFEKVEAFEPVEKHRECFKANVKASNVKLWNNALSDRYQKISMYNGNPGSTGDTWVGGPGDITACPLDRFNFDNVDFLKVDCEGYEYYILLGAVKLIETWKPTIIVEQKPDMAPKFGLRETQAVEFLQSKGAKLRKVISGDYILSWD